MHSAVDRFRTMIRRPAVLMAAAWWIVLVPALGAAHDVEAPLTAVVIDTDAGVDDVVSLALALQHPKVNIESIVASDGVADRASAATFVGQLLDLFNRNEISLFAASADAAGPVPEMRGRAQEIVAAALPSLAGSTSLAFTTSAYRVEDGHTTVVALGPLTQLAAALESDPDLAGEIARVIVTGDPGDPSSWNLARDPAAVTAVRQAGVRLQFVAGHDRAAKPEIWRERLSTPARSTSLGDQLLDRMLADPYHRRHYLESLDRLHDELTMLFVFEPDLFEVSASGDVFSPREGVDVGGRIAEMLRRGRQPKQRVVLADRPLPADAFAPDVRQRREAIIARNGEDEWFAQLLLNELHEHLGAYSIIGVKMALRAAEQLNAPPHSMEIVSSAPPIQPMSCLNDGLLVATGSTPGRNLFRHLPGPPGTVEATFTYNGRPVTLRLKDSYRERIRSQITKLLEQHSLADDGYWDGVRKFGLEIWETWHRLDLFENVAGDPQTIPSERRD